MEKIKEKIKTLGEEQEEKKEEIPFSSVNLLNIEEDLIVTKRFKKEIFKIKLPNPKMKMEIAKRIGYHFNCPLDSIPINDVFTARVLITLDTILEEYPDWWRGAIECYDQNLIFDIYNWYIEEEKKLSEKLKKNKLGFLCKQS